MREVVTTDRALSPSEIRLYRLRQRDVVYRLDYVIVGAQRRRITTFHHIGDAFTR